VNYADFVVIESIDITERLGLHGNRHGYRNLHGNVNRRVFSSTDGSCGREINTFTVTEEQVSSMRIERLRRRRRRRQMQGGSERDVQF
jgi:hypothetical protein